MSDKLDDQLKDAIANYNAIYTSLSDHGIKLFNQRERAMDLLELITHLLNSITNHPKYFDTKIAEIQIKKQEFKDVCDYAEMDLAVAKKSAASSGAGIAGGGGRSFCCSECSHVDCYNVWYCLYRNCNFIVIGCGGN